MREQKSSQERKKYWKTREEGKEKEEDEWNQVSRLEDVITITQVYCYVMVIRYFSFFGVSGVLKHILVRLS